MLVKVFVCSVSLYFAPYATVVLVGSITAICLLVQIHYGLPNHEPGEPAQVSMSAVCRAMQPAQIEGIFVALLKQVRLLVQSHVVPFVSS